LRQNPTLNPGKHPQRRGWNWGLVARKKRDRKTEQEKLSAALDLFTELNLPRQRDVVRAELEKTTTEEAPATL